MKIVVASSFFVCFVFIFRKILMYICSCWISYQLSLSALSGIISSHQWSADPDIHKAPSQPLNRSWPDGLVAWFFLWVSKMEEVLGSIPSQALFCLFFFLASHDNTIGNQLAVPFLDKFSHLQCFQWATNQNKKIWIEKIWFNPGSNWRPSVNTNVRQKS